MYKLTGIFQDSVYNQVINIRMYGLDLDASPNEKFCLVNKILLQKFSNRWRCT